MAPLLLEAALSLSDAAREALLDALGAPSPRPRDGLALARAAFEGRTGPRLTRALFFLARFGTPRGRDAFVEAARALGDARADSWLSLRPADVAAQIAIARATTGKEHARARRAAARIADLALLRVQRDLSERPTYELLATSPLARDASIARAVTRALGAVAIDAWTHEDPDGSLRVAIFTRLPATTRLAFGKSGALSASLEATTAAIDLLHVFPGGARVAITTATPELVLRYVRALSLSLRPSFTNKPLQALDAAALARVPLSAPARKRTVVAKRWRTPDGGRTETRARDVLAAPHAGAGAREEGYLDRSTIRVELDDRSGDAFLQLPHRVELSDPERAADLRAALDPLGVFEPGALPDDARSLLPLEHGEWRWRIVLGDAGFESLVAQKLLVRARVAHLATEAARMYGASYVVHAVPGDAGVEYALAEDRAYGARLVTPDDRAAWRLDRDALAARMRADLGASRVDGAGAIAIDGVLDLGVVALKSGKLRFLYALGAPPKGWLATVRRACGIGVTLVVLAPRGHGVGEGVVVVELDVLEQLGARRVGRALGKAAEALDVAGEVDAWRTCEEDIVIDAATERVWVRGVLVALSEAPRRLLELLARGGRVMTTKELGGKLSAGGYPDEAARRIKMQLEAQVGDGLRRAGDDWDVGGMIVTEGKKGYRLGVSARVFG